MEEGQQNEASSNNEQHPQFFGDYEAIRSIGKGKFAVVYRAHKIGDDQNVALKRISVDMMNDKAREKCLKEVRLLQSLDHPNIIRYMDSFICNNDLIIVYEWAAAGDLKRQLRKAQERGVGFEERVIWKYFSQICNAMQHMHDKRIMHRDLKPANIFLTLEGVIKVGDLGLSRELSDNTFQAHSKVGTPLYMSPEVLKGDGYDFKSDIWSLGCLLYELAMLKSPFRSEGLNLYSLFQKISNGDYQPLPDNYSEELRNLTYSMMSTKPEDRPEIGYVCQVANRMRSQTANDKGNKKRPASGQDIGATISGSEPTNTAEEKNSDRPLETAMKDIESKYDNGQNVVGKAVTIEKDDIMVVQDKKPVRKTSAERKNQNPFQRAPSSSNVISVEEMKGEHAQLGGEEELPKAVEVGVTLGDYFLQQERDHPRKGSLSKGDAWKNANSKPLEANDQVIRSSHEREAMPYTAEDYSAGPTTNRLANGYSSNGAAVQQDSESSNTNTMYRRAKPPRPSSQSNPSYPTALASRVNTAEAISSRPTSGTFPSRPSTVDDMPAYQNTVNDTTNPKLKEALENASAAFALMDLTYGKLQLLGYPMEDPGVTKDRSGKGRLLPIHFAVNINAYQSIAGCHAGYQFNPFKRLVHIIMWLCENKLSAVNQKLQKIVHSIDMETGTNMTIGKQLLQAAQVVGETNEELSSITPSSIIQGYGYNVVVLLNHFADCSLKAINFSANPTIHIMDFEPGQDKNATDSMDEDDNIVPEDEGDVEDEVTDEIASSQMSVSIGRSRFHLPDYAGNKIDPVLWKQETERVAGLLKKGEQLVSIPTSTSWRFHLELLEKYCLTHLEYLKNQETKKLMQPNVVDPMETPLGKHAYNTLTQRSTLVDGGSPLIESLLRLKSLLQSEIQTIAQKERYLNNHPEMGTFGREYATCRQEYIMFEENGNRSTQCITVLNQTLMEIEDQLNDVHRSLAEKISGDSEGGANVVVKMKEAILQLQKEIHEMHMNSVIANEELIERQKHQLYYLNHQRKLKVKKRGKLKVADDDMSL